MMNRAIVAILIALLCICGPATLTHSANNVSDIGIEVALYDDGSAYITQVWNCNFSTGTEARVPLASTKYMDLSGFVVSDINGAYTLVDNWNSNASFNEKAKKSSIVKSDNGLDLCWGITDYGPNRYAIEYKIAGLVEAYSDYDGFTFMFVPADMSTLPTDVTVKVVTQNGKALSAANSDVWASGFKGVIEFQSGQIVAYTESPLAKNTENVTVVIQLNKGILNPTRQAKGTFAAVKNRAAEANIYLIASLVILAIVSALLIWRAIM